MLQEIKMQPLKEKKKKVVKKFKLMQCNNGLGT